MIFFLNISFDCFLHHRTYMLQFFPPAKPHAGRVVLLPHGCDYGAHWRARGDAEAHPLTSRVLATRRPPFPP